jgi:long-chain acyl-CoA synthetase
VIRILVLIFVEDDEQLDKVLEVRERLPLLRRIVVWDMEGLRELHDEQVISFDLARTGRARLARLGQAAADAEWQGRIAARKPADLAILIYTSGTTGRPKGRCSRTPTCSRRVKSFNSSTAQNEDDERMCFLPLCHVAERSSGAYFASTGTKLNFVENPETIPRTCCEIAPDGVRRRTACLGEVLFRCQHCAQGIECLRAVGLKLAIGIGLEKVRQHEKGEPIGSRLEFAHWLARVLVLNNVRKLIGIHPQPHADHRRGADLARTWCAGTWRWACRCWKSGA